MNEKGIIICRIGWMSKYEGVVNENAEKIDTLSNGGEYNKNEIGHEALNFKPIGDFIYGYVQGARNSSDFCDFSKVLGLTDSKEINLNEKDHLDNVDVVFIANNNLGNFIVGWYKDATVYRNYLKLDLKDKRHEANKIFYYTLKVHKDNAHLILENERRIFLPAGSQVTGFPGQSNIYYPLVNRKYEHWNIILPELRKCIAANTILKESETKLIKYMNTIFPQRRLWRIGTVIDDNPYFNYMRENSVICIGWQFLGDLSEKSSADINTRLLKTYKGSQSVATKKTNEIMDFCKKIKIDDIVLAQDGAKILGIGIVIGDYYFNLDSSLHERKVHWIDIANPQLSNSEGLRSTVYNIKDKNLYQKVNHLIEKYGDNVVEKYIKLLKSNHNIILTGAPGTGKTYLAKEMAKKMCKSDDNYDFVQFHPSYDYTDFIEGLRPIKKENQTEISFELKNGIFKAFCKKALENEDQDYVFIIDEINRGEIAKIFGELFFSIDPSYRGKKGAVKTQYANLHNDETAFSDIGFYIPNNVYIIGTMNDIDRSVESFDFAMRRRFTWCEIKPENRKEMLLQLKQHSKLAESLMNKLNSEISKIPGLNEQYHIGPAYFLKLEAYNGDSKQLWDLHLESLLSEYLRGNAKKTEYLEKLRQAFFDEK